MNRPIMQRLGVSGRKLREKQIDNGKNRGDKIAPIIVLQESLERPRRKGRSKKKGGAAND